jgi:hypothetical protein
MKKKIYVSIVVALYLFSLLPAAYSHIWHGDVWLNTGMQEVEKGTSFITDVHIRIYATEDVASYELEISYDNTKIQLNTNVGQGGVDAGPDGLVSSVDTSIENKLIITGYDPAGRSVNTDDDGFRVCTINWIAVSRGIVDLPLQVNVLTDSENNIIGEPNGIDGLISILDVISGDVNNDGTIDIIDALLVAQYYVGLNPTGFEVAAANVTANDTEVDIVDAVVIAQYYVGMRYVLPGADCAEALNLSDIVNNTKKYMGEVNAEFTLVEIVPVNKTYWDYPDGLDIYILTIKDSFDNEADFDIFADEYERYFPVLGEKAVFIIQGTQENLSKAYTALVMHVFAIYIDQSGFETWRIRAR